MKPLPAGLAEPLHLLEPIAWRGWAVAALSALVVAALAYLYFRQRRPHPPRAEPARAGTSLPRSPAAGIAAAIREIRNHYSFLRRYRPGCHELSAALRGHFEQRGRHRYSALTAREISRRLGDTPVTRLLALLSDLQFGRRDPDESDFQAICDLAIEVASRSSGNEG